jgi:hypothetical protein
MCVLWVVTLYSLVVVHQLFRGAFCLHHQGSLKCEQTSPRRHGAASQKTAIFTFNCILELILYSQSFLNIQRFTSYCKNKHASIAKISWLMLLREIITVYSKNHLKLINTLCGQSGTLQIGKVGGTYTCHWASKGYFL